MNGMGERKREREREDRQTEKDRENDGASVTVRGEYRERRTYGDKETDRQKNTIF